jgi:hypothetical protein
MLIPQMAGFQKLLDSVFVLFASIAVVSCGGANVPASDARNNGEAPTSSPVQLKAGDPAPLFSLPASDGKVYSLESYRGKQGVVLAWIAKAFTGP